MNPGKKIYISLAVFSISSILLIAFLIYPFFKEIKANSEELLLEKKKIILLQKEKGNLQKLGEIYKTHQSDLNKIENLFIDPELPVEFINFLEKNASASQVRLKISALTKRTEKQDPWPSLFSQLSVAGPFPGFVKFLEKLENGPYLIETLDLNVKKLPLQEIGAKGLPAESEAILSIKIFTK